MAAGTGVCGEWQVEAWAQSSAIATFARLSSRAGSSSSRSPSTPSSPRPSTSASTVTSASSATTARRSSTYARDEAFVLHPGEFVLGSTLERVALPNYLVARVEGKSSLGRLGLLVHATAGYVDPGWDGHLTMELSNVSNLPIKLYYGMKIGQLSFLELKTPAERPYGSPGLGSKYQGQTGPTASRGYVDYAKRD